MYQKYFYTGFTESHIADEYAFITQQRPVQCLSYQLKRTILLKIRNNMSIFLKIFIK